jgi:hypothetical protein
MTTEQIREIHKIAERTRYNYTSDEERAHQQPIAGLIDASPEMLEALRAITRDARRVINDFWAAYGRITDHMEDLSNGIDMAEEAIAKAAK